MFCCVHPESSYPDVDQVIQVIYYPASYIVLA